MRRVLALSVATIALLAFAVPGASAVDLKLSSRMQTAMTDNYVYWIKQYPPGCKNCDQLWRTDLADGSSTPALKARKGRISRIVSTGSLVGITEIVKTKSKYRSRVRIVNEGGRSRVLASAVYWPERSRNCGSIVGAGALSPMGELAWQRIDVPRSRYKCRELPDRSLWSAFAGGLDRSTRQLVKQRKRESILLYFHEALDQIRPIIGFDGVHLLTAALTVTDVRSGETFKYRIDDDSSSSQYGMLGPAGQVAASFYSDTIDTPVWLLFTSPMSSTPAIDLRVDGYEASSLRFCGDTLVQLVLKKDQGEAEVLRRNLAGSITSSKSFKLGAGTVSPSLQCNASRGVISYSREDSVGRIIAEKTFSFDL